MLNTVLILGGFRLMIGSISGLSHLTKVSGTSEVLGQSTFQTQENMLSGKTVPTYKLRVTVLKLNLRVT